MKAVLFDLDGTLLPMDQDEFTELYFGAVAARFTPLGFDAKQLIAAIWKGTGAMIKNDGGATNERRFWSVFEGIYPGGLERWGAAFESFYENEFSAARRAVSPDPMAARCVRILKDKGYKLALATNPLFPEVATRARTEWAGLEWNDFELVTTYENAHFAKPNLDYYREIAAKLGVRPQDCLMVGNDVAEDLCARALGMEVFLLDSCIINPAGEDVSMIPRGDFAALARYLEGLPGAAG